MIEIGNFHKLKIIKQREFGVYLDGEDLGEILLPRKQIPENTDIGDKVEVFIYRDSKDRLIATTRKPYARVGEFAMLKVVAVESVGAFLNWGLPKDLLVPFREQKQKMEKDKSYIVRIFLDHKSNRIVASSKLDKFLGRQPIDYEIGQQVELLICKHTDIGYKAIINNAHWGVLYENEVFQKLYKGQKVTGYIKKVRDDEKIDLYLQKPGYDKVDNVSEKIFNTLKKQGGFIPVTDKSSPKVIYDMFGASKKTFKKAVGALYKRRLIIIEKNGIKLN